MTLEKRISVAAAKVFMDILGVEAKGEDELAKVLDSTTLDWWDMVIRAAVIRAAEMRQAADAGEQKTRSALRELILLVYRDPPSAPPSADGTTSLEQEAWWLSGYRQALIELAKTLGFSVKLSLVAAESGEKTPGAE